MWRYVLFTTGAGFAGGILALFWSLSAVARNAIQHFAAGAVLAAVASEVVPQLERMGTPAGILGGFAAGGLAMVGLKWLVLRFETMEKRRKRLPVGLAAAAAVDTLMDGAIISAGFSVAVQAGTLLAVVLGIELFFLTLAVGSEFLKQKKNRARALLVTGGIALMLPLGAISGKLALAGASEATVSIVLSFGAAALIYLIAEELLVETIQAESLFSTAMLFAGFLTLLALKLLGPGAP